LRTLGAISIINGISLFEPFTPFTATNNKANPAFGPLTRVKNCDPEIVNKFSEVNRVKGYRRVKGRATRNLCLSLASAITASDLSTDGLSEASMNQDESVALWRRGQLSPHVRVSKMVMRKPAQRLQCEQRKRNCKSKTSVSDGGRCRRCKKPGGYSITAPAAAAHHDHLEPGQIPQA
jgi:hypothetical protein